MLDSTSAEDLLSAIGEQLAAESQRMSIVVAGGTAMNLLGFVDRPTQDVDVLALADDAGQLMPPDPLPEALARAVEAVANDFNQPPDWLNTAVAGQWQTGLPPGLAARVEWRDYGALRVGLVSRTDLIAFKLYAAADQTSSNSVHATDLLALGPTNTELDKAAKWVRSQDSSAGFHAVLDKVISYVHEQSR
jgi:hypothetical protein